MPKNALRYKGYTSLVEFDASSMRLYGSIQGISDGVYFEETDALSIKHAFHETVDDYLVFCREKGKQPEAPYKGSSNIRVEHDLHEKAALAAAKRHESLNQFVVEAIAAAV